MTERPSTHGSSGRGHDGRFLPNNRFGRGNPLAGRAAKIRGMLLQKLTPEVTASIAQKLIQLALREDNMAAIRELLDRTIGKPAQVDVLERIERLEQILEETHDAQLT